MDQAERQLRLVKTTSTTVSKDQNAAGKEQAAWEHAQASGVSRRHYVRDQRILLVDDVCTTGFQLNYVASQLRRQGAADVQGLVLGRFAWDTP
ncbi:hypothetical protein E4198_08950 [Streptomyces sp. RKND-216]|nr:hypothetical protein E4198_08950 [Streptomyces sp. RKND-216]